MSRINTNKGVENLAKNYEIDNNRNIMKKIFFIFISLCFFGVMILGPTFAATQFKLELNFFYSPTCPHCIAEQTFLDMIEKKYPEVKVNRYPIADLNAQEILKDLLTKHDAMKYFGAVPINFVGEDFILGFDNNEGIGKQIEESIQRQLTSTAATTKNKTFPVWVGFVLIIIAALILFIAVKKKKRNIAKYQ